jgi:hypothetical protein
MIDVAIRGVGVAMGLDGGEIPPPPAGTDNLLLESGDDLLLESGELILLESA